MNAEGDGVAEIAVGGMMSKKSGGTGIVEEGKVDAAS